MASGIAAAPPGANAATRWEHQRQRWPWWPLLPLYPYGRRRTMFRELVPDQVWSFEQIQGVLYVAVPIRMTVLRLAEGLLLYGPLPPTGELRSALAGLEERYGPVCTIVLPTSSGLEHKVALPALARAYPRADVWITPHQWSFPLRLPAAWLGIPPRRTRILFEQGLPHAGQLDWQPLGPLDLGLGTFMDLACLHRASGSLMVTDALVAIGQEPPAVFDPDPTPLLFHARERGDEPLQDTPEQRARGWHRLVLFASYLRPASVEVRPVAEQFRHAMAPGLRRASLYFGFYPFRWREGWEQEFERLVPPGAARIQVAPVLERLVFPRCREALLAWLQRLASLQGLDRLIPAHYEAPVPCSASALQHLAEELAGRPWAPDGASWSVLASIDATLLRWGVVPSHPSTPGHGVKDIGP